MILMALKIVLAYPVAESLTYQPFLIPAPISNILIDQVQPVDNFLNARTGLWQWGQLLDHDLP